jgi:hypothetical protein
MPVVIQRLLSGKQAARLVFLEELVLAGGLGGA